MLRYSRFIFLSLILTFFTLLMVRITIPYFSLNTDIAFLRIKQWIIDNTTWKFAFFTHVFSSCFLLIAGFTQFYNPLQKKFNRLHRNIGKLYVVIIIGLSGPASFIMALFANGGWLSQMAFTLLSILWIYFTYKAYLAIRNKDFITHGNFMLRSYALTLSAITLRAWKYLIVFSFHPHPMDVYMLVAWLGWVPNLFFAEWLIHKKLTSKILTVS